MKLTCPTYASPLLYLLCLASEALAETTMSAGCSSTCSSAGNNQICAKSPPVPSLVGIITPPQAHAPQPVAHRNPLPLVWCHCCKSRGVIRRVSTTILNPRRVFHKCPNHGVIICLSVVLLLSVAIFLIVWLMIYQFDSCRKGKIRVIYISGKLLMWGNATTLIIWLAEKSQYHQVGVLDNN